MQSCCFANLNLLPLFAVLAVVAVVISQLKFLNEQYGPIRVIYDIVNGLTGLSTDKALRE